MVRQRLTDEQLSVIADIFPPPKRTGRPLTNPRVVIDAVLWILRTDLSDAICRRSFHRGRRFGTCLANGTPTEFSTRFSNDSTRQQSILARSTENRGVSMARSSARPPCASGGGKKDPEEPSDCAIVRSRGRSTTKLHILCDRDEHPLHFDWTAGQGHQSTAFDDLLIGADETIVMAYSAIQSVKRVAMENAVVVPVLAALSGVMFFVPASVCIGQTGRNLRERTCSLAAGVD